MAALWGAAARGSGRAFCVPGRLWARDGRLWSRGVFGMQALTCARRAATISPALAHGDVAQLGERCLRKAEAGGSNPLISTIETSGRTGFPSGLFFICCCAKLLCYSAIASLAALVPAMRPERNAQPWAFPAKSHGMKPRQSVP